MVLADLGSKVAIALRKMTQATVIDQTVMNEMLSEICKALLQADVNVAQVKHLREQVKKNVDVEALAGGLNKRKMLEQAVCNELCSMLDPGKSPYQPQKKQANVIMFVGLQARARTRTRTPPGWGWRRGAEPRPKDGGEERRRAAWGFRVPRAQQRAARSAVLPTTDCAHGARARNCAHARAHAAVRTRAGSPF